MPRFVGMDEAGLGPNLGPLVIAATAWETPGPPSACGFFELLADSISQSGDHAGRLHIDDSKRVYTSGGGLRSLETSALALCSLVGPCPRSLRELHLRLTEAPPAAREPWAADDLELPLVAEVAQIESRTNALRENLERTGIAPLALRADVIPPFRFNELLQRITSKGLVLSESSLALLTQVWSPADADSLVVADKHGGRNSYGALLAAASGAFPQALEESRERSRYRIGHTEICFQTRAEEHFPVACASLLAKYTREVTMEQFNDWWLREVPGLKPTKGYPEDAKRFRTDIRAAQSRLRVSDEILWRAK